jgi:WD40 repeat protein
MKMNLEKSQADVIKILSVDDKITHVNYGPYDNGYFLVGMNSG